MIAVSIVCSVVATLAAVASVVFAKASTWYLNQASLWRSDYHTAADRAANPPWYVRAAERMDSYLPGGKP